MKGKRFNQKIWKRTGALLLAVLVLFETSGCGKTNRLENATQMQEINDQLTLTAAPTNYGSTYEIFVGSFYDSDGDGMGDLKGVQEKLDYINDGDPAGGQDLGMTGLWLMPVFPSNTYHKYDVTDFAGIDPGLAAKASHRCFEKGLVIELVIMVAVGSALWLLHRALKQKADKK